ncbi:MAG: Tm-1-like ATP-binding domain-containing protein [Thermodesulfobacteriota bacterium]
MKSIAVIATLDTKGPEASYLKSLIEDLHLGTVLLDTSILGPPSESTLIPELSADEIAKAGGEDRRELVQHRSERGARDRGVRAMSRGAAFHLKRLHDEGRICGAIGLGGAQGTEICTFAMRTLPIGVPKVMVSTVASGTTPFGIYTGTKDLTIMHSVVDIMGLNSLTRRILANAAGAIAGMAGMPSPEGSGGKLRVGLTLYGQTTPAGMALKPLLEAAGYEVFSFHSNGTGGKAMEELAGEGFIDAIFDLSTHELTDEILGGIHRGDGERLLRGGLKGVPRLVVPGALDIITLAEPETIPEEYRGQPSVPHNPHITLVRISPAQSRRLAEVMAERLNRSSGPVKVVIPWGGFSFYNREGLHFRDLEADHALVDTLKERLRPDILVHEFEEHINDPSLPGRLFTLFEGMLRTA